MSTTAAIVAAPHDLAYELSVEVPRGHTIRYDFNALVSALGCEDDPSRLAVETHFHRGLVTIYGRNPLARIRAVTRADLAMDRNGSIVVGLYHNGEPAKMRLFDPKSGSAQRFFKLGTTGGGKSRVLQLQLIAEKLNGIVSWVADLKFGQSVPEAEHHVDWFVRTPEGAILLLLAAVAVAKQRMLRYSAAGRTAFWLTPGGDRLLHVHIEEANRLLEKGAPYRDLATYLIKELGRTGRSVGVGIDLCAQASHLEELGGSDTLRAMLKEGEVTLLRWSSTMMKQLVTDGLVPSGEQLMPIGNSLQPRGGLRSQFDPEPDDEDAPGTQGMAYLLNSRRPTALMRHWRVGSIAPLPGLDPEILALYGDDEPARLEQTSHEAAGAAYTARHDADAFQELCEQLRHEHEQAQHPIQPITKTAGSGSNADDDPEPPAPHPARLHERVLAVLAKAAEPMSAEAVLAAVNADGGRKVKIGSVRNDLKALADADSITRAGHGLYGPA
ncbi:hypothetical protein [Nonomuraea typhae]|uniref:Transfer protein n=1 Tax=Nonomuraea typhae TaxID=2603600 RepID=A0ABW7Z696_9ACTN